MKYQQLIIALPCHSLEDFPLYHTGENAEGLLAGWTAQWHPALIATAEGIVTWCRCDTPPEEVANKLIVIPSVGASELPTGFAQRAKEQGGVVIRKESERAKIVATALAELDGGDGGVPADLAADFHALGYCYLQVQLLTRQMRYASNLDEVHFKNVVVDAAKSALGGDHEHARERLQACFNLLAEERDRYYPVEAFVLDLTLVGPTTMGQSLRDDLAAAPLANVLVSGETLQTMQAKEPQTLAVLREAVTDGKVGLIGGHLREGQTTLVARESLFDDLQAGLKVYEECLGRRPVVYGRYRFGLSPVLPQLLAKMGFVGALHVPFEDGRMPEGTQFKVRWEGSDGSALDAIAKPPLDATKAETFLGLAVKMGESMDRDHVATVCLAHWPGKASVWFDDLRRIASYCPALGRFIGIEEYFRQTDVPAHLDRHNIDEYRAPYLKQQVIRRWPDPISNVIRYWRQRVADQACEGVTTLAELVRGTPGSPADFGQRINNYLEDPNYREPEDAALELEVERRAWQGIHDFAAVVPSKGAQQQGYLVTNPFSFVRRVGLCLPELAGLPDIGRPIYAADATAKTKHVVADVPPMGFVWIAPGTKRSHKKDPPLAEGSANTDYVLRNEYFEAKIDPHTGALRSIHEYNARHNRISQQVALRMSDSNSQGDEGAQYSIMAADKVEVTVASTAMGEITTSGRMVDRHGKVLGKFNQKFQVWRGSRVLRIELEIETVEELKSDPWNSYYCVRWAWSDEAAELARAVNEARFVTESKRFEAPHYIEISDTKNRTTILTGGAPYHRRCDYNLLDTLLVVRGETQRKFTFGIGVELAQPLQDAIGLLAPPTFLARQAAPPTPATSSWLFHLDAKNVMATHWSALEIAGKIRGFRARLMEIAGRPGQVSLSAFRPISQARLLDFLGHPIGEAKVEQGKIVLDLAASEWTQVEAEW
jgi:alpha-mannosidase